MKKKIFAALAASVMLCGVLTAPAAADSAEDKSVETNLSYFFELSLDEIEERLNADTTQRDTDSVSIALSISKAQIQKQLADLEPQKEAIETWQMSFRKAYFDLLFDKLHLTGIYDAADPEYLNTFLPSAWIDETDPFTIAETDYDADALCWVKFGYGKNVLLEYNNETITITPYEAAQRTLYVIRTYGDKDYYTSARDDLRGKYIQEGNGTELKAIEQKLAAFVREKGYNAAVLASGEKVVVSFKQQAVGETEYDAAAITQEIRAFCENNSLDFSAVKVIFRASGTGIADVAGDANCDGFCDVADAVLIARFANEDKEAVITDKGKQNADVTHDGDIDGQDAARILQYIAKKIGYDELAAGIDPYIVPIDFSVAGLGVPEKP